MSNSISSGKFRFALVGAGMIANHHARVIRELADQIESCCGSKSHTGKGREDHDSAWWPSVQLID
jgi:predicted dehydrogenase